MLYLKTCTFCEQGLVRPRVCRATASSHLLFLCDECDAMWTAQGVDEKPQFTDPIKSPCLVCQFPLFEKDNSHWATAQECELFKLSEGMLKET